MDITELLTFTAQQNASDLHLSAGLPPMIHRSVERMAGRRLMSRRLQAHMLINGGRINSFRGSASSQE